jgi:hypothetical protein
MRRVRRRRFELRRLHWEAVRPSRQTLHHVRRYLSNRSMPSSGRYGTAFYDLCGVCAPPSSLNNRSCMGCDGVPRSNKTYDACGLCGGELMLSVRTQRRIASCITRRCERSAASLVAYRDSGASRAMYR